MTNGLTSPKAAQGPRTPEAAPEAARGAPPPSDAFAGILGDAQQARTASAEGQSPEKPTSGDDCAKPAHAPDAAPATTDKPAPDAAAAAAAVLAALPVATPAPAAAQAAAAPVAAAAEGSVPVVQVEAPAVEQAAPVPAAAGAPVDQAASLPVAAEAPATTPVEVAPAVAAPVAKPDVPVQAPVAQQAAPEAPKTQPQPLTTSAPAGAGVPSATAQPATGQQQQAQQQSLPQHDGPAPHQAAPAAQPAPTAPAAAPANAVRPAPLPTPTATPVPLPRAAEAVEHVLRVVATSGGVTHARIQLHPAELGSVDVHIRSTAEGLVARVVAHTAQAVQTLQHAANDLRQSLEEQGLNLMSLDIGQPGERRAGGRGHEAAEAEGGAASGDVDAAESAETTTETLRLPTGVLVDVLA